MDERGLRLLVRSVWRPNADDWDDWLQEARLANWKHRDHPIGVQWIAVKRHLINYARHLYGRNDDAREGYKRLHDRPLTIEDRPAHAIDPADWLTLRVALGQLKKRDRAVLIVYAHGFTAHQIAQALGLADITVYKIVLRSRAKLKALAA